MMIRSGIMATATEKKAHVLRQAVRACQRGNWRRGLTLLTPLAQQEEARGTLPGYFYSFLGHAIARCEGRKAVGLELCRYAVRSQPLQPENHLNLARTHLLLGQRRLALKAMHDGLALDPTHRGLSRLAVELGVRRPSPLPFLPRTHFLNRLIGRLTYRVRRHLEERRRRREEEAELETTD